VWAFHRGAVAAVAFGATVVAGVTTEVGRAAVAGGAVGDAVTLGSVQDAVIRPSSRRVFASTFIRTP
jgi:hypothetical protein